MAERIDMFRVYRSIAGTENLAENPGNSGPYVRPRLGLVSPGMSGVMIDAWSRAGRTAVSARDAAHVEVEKINTERTIFRYSGIDLRPKQVAPQVGSGTYFKVEVVPDTPTRDRLLDDAVRICADSGDERFDVLEELDNKIRDAAANIRSYGSFDIARYRRRQDALGFIAAINEINPGLDYDFSGLVMDEILNINES